MLQLLVRELFRKSPWLTWSADGTKIDIDWQGFVKQSSDRASSLALPHGTSTDKGYNGDALHTSVVSVCQCLLGTIDSRWFEPGSLRYRFSSGEPQPMAEVPDVTRTDQENWAGFENIAVRLLKLAESWPESLVARLDEYGRRVSREEIRRVLGNILEALKGRPSAWVSLAIHPALLFPGDQCRLPFGTYYKPASQAVPLMLLRKMVRSRFVWWRELSQIYRQGPEGMEERVMALLDGQSLQRLTADFVELAAFYCGPHDYAPRCPRDQEEENMTAGLARTLSRGIKVVYGVPCAEVSGGFRLGGGYGASGSAAVRTAQNLCDSMGNLIESFLEESPYSRLTLKRLVGNDKEEILRSEKAAIVQELKLLGHAARRSAEKEMRYWEPFVQKVSSTIASLIADSPLLSCLGSAFLRTYADASGRRGICLGGGILAGELSVRTFGALPLDVYSVYDDESVDDGGVAASEQPVVH